MRGYLSLSAMAEAGLAHGERLAFALHPRPDDLAGDERGVAGDEVAGHAALHVAESLGEYREPVRAGGMRQGGQLVSRAGARLPERPGELALARLEDVDGEEP